MAHAAEINVGSTPPTEPNPPVDGTAEIVLPSKPFYRRILENFLPTPPTQDKASDLGAETPAEDATATTTAGATTTAVATMTTPVQLAAQLTQEEISKMQRDILDADYYAELDKRAEQAIKNPNRKLRWNADINPNDNEWTEQRTKFRAMLAANSISDVLKAEFEDGQKLLLIPPQEDGPLLQVQLENAKDYKEFFKPGARFHGVMDNLVTKLTMLKFGLPIEAVTLKNVERCDNPLDEDDPPDDPEPVPSVQRIMYFEKPLEFLDSYSERSFGYPMLRSKSQCISILSARLLTNEGQNATISISGLLIVKILLQEVTSQIQLKQ